MEQLFHGKSGLKCWKDNGGLILSLYLLVDNVFEYLKSSYEKSLVDYRDDMKIYSEQLREIVLNNTGLMIFILTVIGGFLSYLVKLFFNLPLDFKIPCTVLNFLRSSGSPFDGLCLFFLALIPLCLYFFIFELRSINYGAKNSKNDKSEEMYRFNKWEIWRLSFYIVGLLACFCGALPALLTDEAMIKASYYSMVVPCLFACYLFYLTGFQRYGTRRLSFFVRGKFKGFGSSWLVYCPLLLSLAFFLILDTHSFMLVSDENILSGLRNISSICLIYALCVYYLWFFLFFMMYFHKYHYFPQQESLNESSEKKLTNETKKNFSNDVQQESHSNNDKNNRKPSYWCIRSLMLYILIVIFAIFGMFWFMFFTFCSFNWIL